MFFVCCSCIVNKCTTIALHVSFTIAPYHNLLFCLTDLRIRELERKVKCQQEEIWLMEDNSNESEILRSINEKLTFDVSK